MASVRKRTLTALLIIISGLSCLSSVMAQSPKSVKDPLDTMTGMMNRIRYIKERMLYEAFVEPYIEVDAFLIPRVEINSDLETELNDDILTDYLKLRMKNNLAEYPLLFAYNPYDGLFCDSFPGDKIDIRVNVWTVGSEYPIAIHVELTEISSGCPTESSESEEVHTDAILCVTSPAKAEEWVKRGIDQLVERFAIKFLKAKGDI